ncbi:glutamate-5-semialdehyde dehydrogenase [Petrotoga olearia]|uniref:Gamma-glutamyl phosphate reductase n=2 Tax=Petrotoga olearia TaxID=156203 RepID=A0A2K1NX06_9BACT|nr:glutamate-5-semialdehyde dehydrogenase [Petrotoga olearia]PNR95073.1 gamma-glutamyl phosphate reductase [Petrotoga olearia DSM 13574]RMA72882.1 glutamate-5-semialdehyde dehydrogenase [Petrotoga olearia]
MNLEEYVLNKARNAKDASRNFSSTSDTDKIKILNCISEELITNKNYIISENQKDVEAAKNTGMSNSLLDRLILNDERVTKMAKGVQKVAQLQSSVGNISEMWKRPNGLMIGKMVVPLGVIAIIYESRPNVTIDAAALCIKSGNCVVLRGGSEAIHSNNALVKIIHQGIEKSGFSKDIVQFIEVTDRKAVDELMKLYEHIDVLIPRGGASLIKNTVENSMIPVIQTGAGNCHVYVDKQADLEKALKIVENAKTSRPSVCNAAEKLLVHKDIAEEFLPKIYSAFEKKVELRGCEKTLKILPQMKPTQEDDWSTEYLDYIMAVKIVDSTEEAINHINKYSTKHSEAIITENYTTAQKFLNEIDSAAVYVNASTRFTDGEEFGFGAEMGISTQKLHVRGPIGIKELTTTKYIILGNGQVR